MGAPLRRLSPSFFINRSHLLVLAKRNPYYRLRMVKQCNARKRQVLLRVEEQTETKGAKIRSIEEDKQRKRERKKEKSRARSKFGT